MGKCRVIGLLSGTSMDAWDVAAAELTMRADEIELHPLGHLELPYPEGLREELRNPTPEESWSARWCRLDAETGRELARAARIGLDELAAGRADLVTSLGQTVHHLVEHGRTTGTLQLGQPSWIAESTGLPVVSDPRGRDVAAGGQGAPLAPVFDTLWLRGLLRDRPSAEARSATAAALNIGGMANITVLGEAGTLGYDTGPGNALIDAAVSLGPTGRTSDHGGEIAARGRTRTDLLEELWKDDYYARRPPKSTGREHFDHDYLRRRLAEVPHVDEADLVATVTRLTALTVAEECSACSADFVVASGGGVANPVLYGELRRELGNRGIELSTSDEHGVPRAAKEAYLTTLLGFLTLHGIAGNVPSATGAAGPRVLGSITPGRAPVRLPPPHRTPVRTLRVLG
ncbi:anhydro-N-acetylmuramic acid kinase [Actinopolyspora mortivallis]|uniref:Anhydro-N-acetylmuramic acid kinase n=1 Tax=Actinopolyspora mortivallis TaxID=33906 RepID=A0A2T0GTY3_ACTMO|nr:anhydro-N-acetylmuramic acid kinase [Actinopolyspora mortivallis]